MKNYWLKRVLAVSLAAAMVLGGAVSVQAAEVEPQEEVTEENAVETEENAASQAEAAQGVTIVDQGTGYTLDSEGTLTCSNYSGDGTWSVFNWMNPYEKRYLVKKLVVEEGITDFTAYWSGGILEEVVLPDGLKQMRGSFDNCTNLKKINLPSGLESLGTFNNCTSLERLDIPSSVTHIWTMTFWGCSNLMSGTYGDLSWEMDGEGTVTVTGEAESLICLWDASTAKKVNIIGKVSNIYGFAGTSMTEINLPEGLMTIESSTFASCENLKGIKLPSSLGEIGEYAFQRSGLTNIEIPGSVSKISYKDFYRCTDLEAVVLKDGIKSIDEAAFADCGLKDITIPASVTEIGQAAIGYHIDESKYTKGAAPETFQFKVENLPTIHCYADTAAHKYAVENGIPFELLSGSNGSGTSSSGNNAGTTAPVELSSQKITEETAKIQNAAEGADLIISMGTATVVPKEFLAAAKGRDVDLILQMNGYTWSINGKDITAADLKSINLEVKRNTSAIPADRLKATAGDNPVEQISLTYNGEFGFTARLTLNVGSKYAGKAGKLYYYNNKGELELQDTAGISKDGRVTLKFKHASDYAIVITEATSPKTGQDGLWLVLAVMLVSAAGVFVMYRRKKEYQ